MVLLLNNTKIKKKTDRIKYNCLIKKPIIFFINFVKYGLILKELMNHNISSATIWQNILVQKESVLRVQFLRKINVFVSIFLRNVSKHILERPFSKQM